MAASPESSSGDSALTDLSSHGFNSEVEASDDDRTVSDGQAPEDPRFLTARPPPRVADMPTYPVVKRQKTGPLSRVDRISWHDRELSEAPLPDNVSLSSDTEGSVPSSPNHPQIDEDALASEQVRVCKWDGCPAGDLGNMDRLVDHIHEEHIMSRLKNYACMWGDCSRKGIKHLSGYALKAHMRSHTKEKPFYCSLPGGSVSRGFRGPQLTLDSSECDRAFTRSDALAKHMRTVHETDQALRPSDSNPKGQPLSHLSSAQQHSKPKITLKFNRTQNNSGSPLTQNGTMAPSHLPEDADTDDVFPDNLNNARFVALPKADDVDEAGRRGYTVEFPQDIAATFSSADRSIPADQLFRLLRRQLHWALEEKKELQREADASERQLKSEWYTKEVLLDECMMKEVMRVLDNPDPGSIKSIAGEEAVDMYHELKGIGSGREPEPLGVEKIFKRAPNQA